MGDDWWGRLEKLGKEYPEGQTRYSVGKLMEKTGLQEAPSVGGKILGALGTAADAPFAAGGALARGEGLGTAAKEFGQALLQRRQGAQFEELNKLIPSDNAFATVGKMALGFATDPLTYFNPQGLTAKGLKAFKATPELFLGAGKLTKAERVAQGLEHAISFGNPLSKRAFGIMPQALEARAVDLTSRGFKAMGNTIKSGIYATKAGRKASEVFLNAFRYRGATKEVGELRDVVESMHENIARHFFDDIRFTSALDKGADDIADHLSKQLGRKVDGSEVADWAFDYAENSVRDPGRFVDTPDLIKEYAALQRQSMSDLLAFERGAGKDIAEMGGAASVGRKAVAKRAISETFDFARDIRDSGIEGVKPKTGISLKKQALRPTKAGPTYFDPVEIPTEGLKGQDLEAAKTANEKRIEFAQFLNNEIAMSIDETLLDPEYLPHVTSDYGEEFYGLNRDQMKNVARFGKDHPSIAGMKGADRFEKSRQFTKADGTRLGMVEKQKLAEEGRLPGYEGKIATGKLYQSRPLGSLLPRLTEGHIAGEQLKAAQAIADKWGVKVTGDAKAEARAVSEGLHSVSDSHEILRHYRFPEWVAKELKWSPLLASTTHPAWKGMMALAGEANRIFMDSLLLVPATIARNGTDEFARSILGAGLAGASTADAGFAMGVMSDIWGPLAKTIERAVDGRPVFQELRQMGLARMEGITEGKLGINMNPPEIGPEGFMGVAKDAMGNRVKQFVTPMDITGELFSRNILRGGWSPTDLQQSARRAFTRMRKPGRLAKLFHQNRFFPLSEAFIPRRFLSRLQNAADDFPRIMHYTTLRRIGLTADEAALELGKWHPNIKLTPFEKKIATKAIPFYRWTKFSIPYSFRQLIKAPHIPYLIHKAYQYLSSGIAPVDERDIPSYLKRMMALPIDEIRTPEGKRVLAWTGPGGTVSFFDALRWMDPEAATDNLWGLLNPFITAWADSDGGSTKDDLFLGQRMSSKTATFLRRTWRYGNILDKMWFPKGQSEAERSFRRSIAIQQLLSPLAMGVTVEGEELNRKRVMLKVAANETKDWMRRTLSARGRIRGTGHADSVVRQARSTLSDIAKELRELESF